ncbi:tRNA (adenosine(37)-N6)-threonylcarbamoyltransferase complex ATPase subunit type 1 TsaE [Flagellimonas sp. 389]|uniref:tRNA (adenosine(37)-N6)-threonylcarbamoyltransferase complex ATPase subunit type 1 TsaE n=1 Tax=Flagellimonas sp. 389 TaxID=2835862 RepID=UPI001BD2579C|nr:tRNA (adenosine(37)-N6)-threonylcarbamoyltransferase complex ATPase subunit type 1 TsaE [Flagellimonas sp. 389]MBS9463607.1 tRNA (adenosine(37)-N6)-threonylcarbamoyltransferase complex ATPase subunit type 1 TsaE [Flagellimonas sp. 389]
MKPLTFTLNQLQAISKKIIHGSKSKILCFYGDMGVGKTTLIKSIVAALGGDGNTHSPTFGLVNEYYNKKNEQIAFHFDFYRIEDEAEALDMGLEDYFSTDIWIFIEWAEKIGSLLPEEAVTIHLQFIDENTRSIEFNMDTK